MGVLLLAAIVCLFSAATVYSSDDSVDICCSSSQANNCDQQCWDLQCHTEGESVQNSTKVIFQACPNPYMLATLLSISRKNNISFQGTANSTIQCNGTNNTGLTFSNIQNLRLKDLNITRCRVNIINCVNVAIENILITDSQGIGLVFKNTRGNIRVVNTTFRNNGNTQAGGGIYINIDSSQNDQSVTTSYVIKGSRFISNKSPSSIHDDELIYHLVNNTYNKFDERGGGLYLHIDGHTTNATFTIADCTFSNNEASHGGGMFVLVKEFCANNTVTVSNSTFTNNTCQNGGGALQLGYILDVSETATVKNNVIHIQDCQFSNNSARYGGGTAIFSTMGSYSELKNQIQFTNCTWTRNQAQLGLAVDIAIAPWETFTMNRHLPTPVFSNCSFSDNTQIILSQMVVNNARSAFVTTGFNVEFGARTCFTNNTGTAIQVMSSTIDFQANSTVLFDNNRGIEGGAMKLIGMSVMYVRDHSTFQFLNNTARKSGGAIYVQTYDKHTFISSKSCFLQHKGEGQPRNVSLIFKDNIADYSWTKPNNSSKNRHRGNSLFATSLYPCIGKCTQLLTNKNLTVAEALTCIGDFEFDSQADKRRRQFSTEASHFRRSDTGPINDTKCPIHLEVDQQVIWKNPNYRPTEKYKPIGDTLKFIPGKATDIPLKLVDDLCGEISFSVSVSVLSSVYSSIRVHSAHTVITDNRITLYGMPNDTGSIQLNAIGVRNTAITIKVEMTDCAPGFIFDNKSNCCFCSADNENHTYVGIERCNVSSAFIKRGYWVGYLNEHTLSPKEQDLATAVCPKGFCTNHTHNLSRGQALPPHASQDINIYVCNANRIGKLCGKCKDNYSAYYRAMSFFCGKNDNCHLGWIIYIVSELIPVTLLFLVVIFFNLSFTTGGLNGVILFMQVVDTLKVKADSFIYFEKTTNNFSKIYKLVYRMFSLNFIAIQKGSFCLWEGASALDLLAFKYVTIVYSLLLVIITVAIMKMCNFKRLCGHLKKSSNFNSKHSIIHGLSAFLVVSYSECTRVSLLILTRGTLHIGPGSPGKSSGTSFVVFYSGTYEYLGPEHLKYAIPAIFFIIFVVCLPPLLLFGYPLCYKVFALLGMEESRWVRLTCKILPLEKIKPMFDSIQGSFKDRYRFFAGLYFLYRLCALLTFALSPDFPTHYTWTGIQLVFMLTLHAVCRPYKRAWHNILDALLFFNLAVINSITLYNFQLSSGAVDHQDIVDVSTGIQTALILLPLLYLMLYTAYNIVLKVKTACMSKQTARENIEDTSDDIIHELDNREIDEPPGETDKYILMKEDPSSNWL